MHTHLEQNGYLLYPEEDSQYAHLDQDELITQILTQIAQESRKTLARIKRLLLIKQNAAINRRFWQILDEILPGHPYSYVGCCGDCGALELREELP